MSTKPIFIAAFARGGSGILLNILRSHPDVCSPSGELQEVIYGKRYSHETPWRIWGKRIQARHLLKSMGSRYFSIKNWEKRTEAFSPQDKLRLNQILDIEKLRATGPTQNKFKAEGVLYTKEEIAQSRTMVKNLNGLIMASEAFLKTYEDATFIALVRNPYAVVEGHLRRGFEIRQFTKNLNDAMLEMSRLSSAYLNFHVYKFEDILQNPQDSLHKVFAACDLDVSKVAKVRKVKRKAMDKDGKRRVKGAGLIRNLFPNHFQQLTWYPIEDFGDGF